MSRDVWQRKFAFLDWHLEGVIRSQYDNPTNDQAILSAEALARDWAVKGAVKGAVRDAQDDKIKASLDKFLGTGNEHYFVDALALPYQLAP